MKCDNKGRKDRMECLVNPLFKEGGEVLSSQQTECLERGSQLDLHFGECDEDGIDGGAE